MNSAYDITLFSIKYSDDGLSLSMYIDTTGTEENPNYKVDCKGLILSSIQNCFFPEDDDGLPIFLGLIEALPLKNNNVQDKLTELGFSFKLSSEHSFGGCFYVRAESGDFLAEIICRECVFIGLID